MKLSIITINLNNKAGLQKTIDSVISQTFKDFEWIVIDGGSTDSSKELIEKYSDHISYWVSETDKGVYDAMNKGIDVANGDYLLFLNSGDELNDNGVISKIVNDNNVEDIIVYDIILHSEGKTVVKDLSYLKNLSIVSFLISSTFPHQSTLIRRYLFYKIGMYDLNYIIVADWVFFWKACVLCNASIRYREGNVISIYDMDGISTKNNVKAQEERKSFLSRLYSKRMFDYLNQSSTKDNEIVKLNRPFYRFIFRGLLWISNKF